MHSEKKCKEIHDLIEKLGVKETAKRLNLKIETVQRVDRKFRSLLKKEPQKSAPNILLLDIETAPSSAYVWRFFKENINQEQVIADWFMIGWAVKWLNEPDVYSDILSPDEALNKDDERITRNLWEYIDSADIIIGQNISAFDIPKINTRFLIHGLMPPSPYYTIDTLVTLKKYFGFSMNRLNYVNYILGLDQKEPTTFQLWVDCLNGEIEALRKMESYNRNDVLILEELYLKIRAWIKSHPNVGLFIDENSLAKDDKVCPVCGGKRFEYCGEYTTPISSYNSYRCFSCGAVGRVGKNSISTEKKKKLLRSIAK